MLTKDKVKELVEHMPEPFSVDNLIEEIKLLEKIEKAKKQMESGDFITEEDLDKEADAWR